MNRIKIKKILVCDSQNFFSKLLVKNFSKEFAIERSTFYHPMDAYSQETHLLIYVIYNDKELTSFKRIFRKKMTVLVCVFNKQVLRDISYMEKGNRFFLLNGSQKIKNEILTELSDFLNYSVTGYGELVLGRYLSHEYDFESCQFEI
jgi:hypothetical protein